MILIVDLEELKRRIMKIAAAVTAIMAAVFFLWVFASWICHVFLGLPAGAYNFFTVLLNLYY